jgi:hypothetical protein
MEKMLREHEGKDIVFQPRDGETKINLGDVVFLCETAAKRNPGVLGKARVTGPATKDIEGPEWQQRFWIGKESDRGDLPRVPMEIIHVFKSRISRSELRENPRLKNLPFAKGYQGTMREVTDIQASELDRLADR